MKRFEGQLTVGDLRKLIEGRPDDAEVATPVNDAMHFLAAARYREHDRVFEVRFRPDPGDVRLVEVERRPLVRNYTIVGVNPTGTLRAAYDMVDAPDFDLGMTAEEFGREFITPTEWEAVARDRGRYARTGGDEFGDWEGDKAVADFNAPPPDGP